MFMASSAVTKFAVCMSPSCVVRIFVIWYLGTLFQTLFQSVSDNVTLQNAPTLSSYPFSSCNVCRRIQRKAQPQPLNPKRLQEDTTQGASCRRMQKMSQKGLEVLKKVKGKKIATQRKQEGQKQTPWNERPIQCLKSPDYWVLKSLKSRTTRHI